MQYRILGPLEVFADGKSIAVGGPKQRALLALLLLSANRVVARDRLIEELWPDQPRAQAEHTLTVQVSRLRKVLAAAGDGDSLLVTRSPGYVLVVESGDLDLDRFERLAAEGRQALQNGEPGEAAASLREAESLWRGRPLADLEFEPFARVDVDRLIELQLGAVEERIDAELALGRHAVLVAELEALVAEHPLRERFRAQLMLALYRSGRQADALAAYRSGRALLVEELGLNPGPRLQELERAILRHDDQLELKRTEATAVTATDAAPDPVVGVPPTTVGQPARRRGGVLALAVVLVVTGVAVGLVIVSGGSVETRAALRGNAVAMVSPGTGGPSASVALGAAPTRLAAGQGDLWITHVDAGMVTRVERATRAVRQTIRVGTGPSGIAVAAGDVWVANTLDGTISRIDAETDAVVQTIPVGSQPSAVAASDGAVWVANRGDGTIARLDSQTGRVSTRVRTGDGPSGLAISDDNVWVSNEDAGTVSRVDADSGTLVRTIRVGDAPSAIAVTPHGVWIVDRLDATLSHIDPARDIVDATIPVGGTPSDVTVFNGEVWVPNATTGAVARVDPRRGAVTRATAFGERPGPIAAAGGDLWVGVSAGGAQHRGGTLTVAFGGTAEPTYDPAMGGPPAALGLTNDGLVSFDHTAGPGAARLVPNLAMSLPLPSDGGRTYVFRLRPGIRYSNGATVTAGDVRHSLERVFALRTPGMSFYDQIAGARACRTAERCDLSHGVVTDNRKGTVTFHLIAPDPDFLQKLAQPYAYALPATTPVEEARAPLPATGPYVVSDSPTEVRYDRNPRFREWSGAAQPSGYPDHIVWPKGLSASRATTLVKRGEADLNINIGPAPRGQRRELSTRFAGQLRVNPWLGTAFFFLNARAKPFDDVRVRRALNFAIDRRRMVEIYGGPQGAQPTCQLLPPQMPGFARHCPYTRDPRRGGRWRAPDLRRAHRLVAASGTRGTHVKVWSTTSPQVAADEGRYVTALLQRLGYRASLHLLKERRFHAYTENARNRAQIVSGGWTADYPAASSFIGKLSCPNFNPGNGSSWDTSGYCEPAIDRRIARAQAQQTTDPTRANKLWARLDRALTDRAVWLPTVTPKDTNVLSRRTGNYHHHPFLGPLIDQLWVR